MLLAIDAGNTQTVLGLWDLDVPCGSKGAGLVGPWRIATDPERTSDEMAVLVSQLLGLAGYDWRTAVEGAVICSTVPLVGEQLRAMIRSWLSVPCLTVGQDAKVGMVVLYDDPSDVGADRIANAVAALDLGGAPCIVVDFGTATTLDAISADGAYLGGAIVPGVEVSMEALFSRASLLRRIELIEPTRAIGRSTADALRSGALFGYAALADGLCERFIAELGPCTVLSTGGLGGLISPYSSRISRHVPWLTLHGLRLIFERNS